MPRKKSLLYHPPTPSMSLRQEARLFSKKLRALEAKEPTPEIINLMVRLSQRLGKIRAQIERKDRPPRPVGRPKTVNPEPVVEVDEQANALEAVLQAEQQQRAEPSAFEQQAAQLHAIAETRRAKEEAVEIAPITAPQSDDHKTGDGVTPPNPPSLVSPALLDVFNAVTRTTRVSADNEVEGPCVGLTNSLGSYYERPAPVQSFGEQFPEDNFGKNTRDDVSWRK
jgi:hypothetical protein